MTEQGAVYPYKLLPPQHVRILRLDGFGHLDTPNVRLHGEVLVSRLETISLGDIKRNHEEYFALSYCWQRGKYVKELDTKDCHIWCDDRLVQLQPNLHSALWHLAKQEDGPRAIWADALCVDQSNIQEKGQQVSIMGDIYGSVGCVIAWLGPEGEKVKDLFAALTLFAREGPPPDHSEWEINVSSKDDSRESVTPSEGELDQAGNSLLNFDFNFDTVLSNPRDRKGLTFRRLKNWLKRRGSLRITLATFWRSLFQRRKRQVYWDFGIKPDHLKSDHDKIQDGLTFVRCCGWFQRAWTFQEICLATRAIVQAGNQQIDWNTISSGWQSRRLIGFNDWRNILREIRFVEMARRDAFDLLVLLRSIWNRHATDKRDKAYAILGLYRGSLSVDADYKLSIRQALVRISRAAIEETRSLDVLHYAGMGHCPCPLWGPKKLTLPRESRDTLDNQQDSTGGWHLPSWAPDWGSTHNKDFPMKTVDSLRKLEFPSLNARFRFDVRWNGENMMASGIALGRFLQFENPTDELRPKVMIVPFPDCAFNGYPGGSPQWPTSASLSKVHTSFSQNKDPVKTNITDFVYRVKMHDEARCLCSDAVDRPTKSISYHSDHGEYFLLRYPLEYGLLRPLDWAVVLLGTRSSMVLRPDCRVHPDPWKLANESKHHHVADGAFLSPEDEPEDNLRSTFVLVDAQDDDGKGNPRDELNTYHEVTRKLKRLGCLSCVYGDFEIR